MAGFFSDALREQIRAANDIVDVIGSYLPLKRAGANFVALCPFHKEKSPSFNVNPHRQIFHCFGCHKGGDVFTFVKEYENIPFPDAVKRLADRAKIPLEMDNSPAQQQSRHLKDVLLHIHEQITQRWQNALANEASGQIARDYLAQRGVSEEGVKLFRIGYAPEVWDDTVNWSKSKGFDLAVMEQSGLILRKEGTDHHYDRFRGRLIFPICDEQGRVIGFSGRVLSGDQKTAKYVNSPETPIFTKGKVFFGLDKSKRAVLDAKSVIVCEGQLDLIACYMAGVQNIVAPQGTALTADHARILKRYADEVVLCFDSDNAGQNAAVRSLDSLLASGLAIRVAMVPAPHDPDSFIKESGGEAFKELINRSGGFFDYYLNRLCATNDANSDKGRVTILQEMAEAVHKTGNVVLIDTYAQKTAFRLGVSPEAVRAEFKKASRLKSAAANPQENTSDLSPNTNEARQVSIHEFLLAKIILDNDEHTEWVAAHLDVNWISNHQIREIIRQRLKLHASGAWAGIPALLDNFEDEAVRNLIHEVVMRPIIENAGKRVRLIPNQFQQLKDVVFSLRNEYLDQEISIVTQHMHMAGASTVEQKQFYQQQQSLKNLKKQPLTPLAEPEGPF